MRLWFKSQSLLLLGYFMEINYKNAANKNGIYRIFNKENGRIYIGSTIRFKKRFPSHINRLLRSKHENTFLQNDWNKCGSDMFLFEVLEIVENVAELSEREQFYLDQYYDNQLRCYNLRPDACDSRAGRKQRLPTDPFADGRCQSPSAEALEKRSKAIKKAYEDPTLREVSRQNALKKWANYSANVSLTHLVTGETIEVSGSLREFALSKGLSYKSLHQLVKGKIKSSGGWYLSGQKPIFMSQKGQKRKPLTTEHRSRIAGMKKYEVVDPDGRVVVVSGNVKEFCREKNLDYTTFCKVIKHKKGSCKGWTSKRNSE